MTLPPLDPAVGRLTSGFGPRSLRGRPDLHTGIDIAAPIGTPVVAVRAGRVVTSAPPGQLGGYGNVVVIDHDGAGYSLYAHLHSRSVSIGDRVQEGQTIGVVGDTGGARGVVDHRIGAAHLHFELLTKWPSKPDENRIDPTRLWPPALRTTPRPVQLTPVVAKPPAAAQTRSGAVLFAIGAWMWSKRKRRQRA